MTNDSTASATRQARRRKTATPSYGGERVVGCVEGDWFQKTLVGAKHTLCTVRVICSDNSTLDDAEQAGPTRYEVFDSETGSNYAVAISAIRARGFSVNYGGCSTQVRLLLREWAVDAMPPAPTPAVLPEQLKLRGTAR